LGVTANTWTAANLPEQSVENQEIGSSIRIPWVLPTISIYHRSFTGLQYQPTNGLGGHLGDKLVFGSDSKGVNFNIVVSPIEHAKVALIGNYLDGIYTGSSPVSLIRTPLRA